MSLSINEKYSYQIGSRQTNHADQYRIRAMSTTDIPTVAEIDQSTWRDGSWPIESFLDALNDPEWNCWILEGTNGANHNIFGYGHQYLSDDTSHIANLCIHPDRRGHGLGGILLSHMIDHAIQSLTSAVELEVLTTNSHALRLYRKHGFEISEFLAEYYSADADAYRMRLLINRKKHLATDYHTDTPNLDKLSISDSFT